MGIFTWVNFGVSEQREIRLLENSPWRWNKSGHVLRCQVNSLPFVFIDFTCQWRSRHPALLAFPFAWWRRDVRHAPGRKKLFKKPRDTGHDVEWDFCAERRSLAGARTAAFQRISRNPAPGKTSRPAIELPQLINSVNKPRDEEAPLPGWLTPRAAVAGCLAKSLSENYLRLSKIVLPPAQEKWIKPSSRYCCRLLVELEKEINEDVLVTSRIKGLYIEWEKMTGCGWKIIALVGNTFLCVFPYCQILLSKLWL